MATVSKCRLSYHRRLFLLLLGISWVLVGCFVAYQYGREKYFKIERLDARLQLLNLRLLDELAAGVRPDSLMAGNAGRFPGLRLTILDHKGRVHYDSRSDTTRLANHLNRPEVRAALINGSGYTLERLSESTHGHYFYSAMRGDSLIVRSALPYNLELSEVLAADRGFLWFMLGVTLLMSVAGYFATRRLGHNIVRLRDFAERAERGEVIRIKKQLTNNINHELKTPVAAIQGYLETLLANPGIDAARQRAFLEKSLAQTGRLRQLLTDVSIITRMDEGSQLISKEPVVLNDIIAEVAADVQLLPPERRLRVHCDFPGPVEVCGSPSLLTSVFRNLTDNATAYSSGRDIFIRLLADDEESCTISFADNGIGIEEEHLPHIFERFYRIDKGRSRKMGGTGLGLSIVRNAIAIHGGTITAHNRPQGGLEFIFTLRKHS